MAELITLEPWADRDADLLARLNAPEMTEHLGGPESPEKLADRQRRYVSYSDPAVTAMFRVVLTATGEAVGSVGYWEREWQGATVYEMGWGVLPEYQGRGIAVAAARAAVGRARAQHRHARIHAYPSHDNPPSNAVCRKVGFTLVGECDFEYPPGNPMRCNDWSLSLIETPDEVRVQLDALMDRFFAAVSFPIGSRPRYEDLADLFGPGARLIRGGPGPAQPMSVDAFVAARQADVDAGSLTTFTETERPARTEVFGAVAQRFGPYEKSGVRDGVGFAGAGVILTQFVQGDDGWRISSMAWDDERPGLSRDGLA